MWRTALLLLLWSSVQLAQTADTALFRAVLLPSSEVPAVSNLNARGVADISLNVVRDPSGQIISGTVDILAVLRWIESKGWFGNVTLSYPQFGFEITSTNNTGENFIANNFTVSYN